jgi:hydroxymethylpyrimidine/phosphomethylpyrimidine kinase
MGRDRSRILSLLGYQRPSGTVNHSRRRAAKAMKVKHPRLPCALAIGGLDPGGGAGLAADLRAFAAAGVFGCAVASVLTVQSTAGLRAVRAVAPELVVAQAKEVLRNQRVRAVKVGALGTVANVRAVTRLLEGYRGVPVVVDTPMLPTRGRAGARLLAAGAVGTLWELLRLASLVTVNVDEVQALLGLGVRVRDVEEAREAAKRLVAMGPRAVIVKGGHLRGPVATDVLAVGAQVTELQARRVPVGAVHGTGCVLASLIAGRLARRAGRGRVVLDELTSAIRWAKRTHHAALARASDVGRGMRVLVLG